MRSFVSCGFVLCFILALLPVSPLQATQVQLNEISQEQQVRALFPDATFGYAWVVGSSFQPRSSSTSYAYASGGCLYQNLGNPDWFTADLQLPDGAEMLGLRYYAYDGSSLADSELAMVAYNGQGGVQDVVNVYSEGSAGFGQFYAATSATLTLDSSAQALSVLWSPGDVGPNLRLCGARVFFRYPDQTTAERQYKMYAAANFQRRESSISYAYGGAGCVYSPSGGALSIDVDLPQGSTLDEMTVFYYDNSAQSVQGFASVYDGQGFGTNVLSMSSLDAVAAYRQTTITPTDILLIDESEQGLVLSFIARLDPNARVCAMRVGFTLPTTPPVALDLPVTLEAERTTPFLLDSGFTGEDVADYLEPAPVQTILKQARGITEIFVAGSTFQPRSSEVAFIYRGAGCISATNSSDFFQADLQLPDGALVVSLEHLYRDQSSNDSILNLFAFNGLGNFTPVAQTFSGAANAEGYGRTVAQANHVVDLFEAGYGLVWSSPDSTLELCGARVRYTLLVAAPVYLPLMVK